MTNYKLTYFNLEARAEIIRWIFATAGVEYDDDRIPHPPSSSYVNDIKPHLPFGQVPILEIDGKVYCQSFAIARYLANKFGLAGDTDMDQFRADMIAESVSTMKDQVQRLYIRPPHLQGITPEQLVEYRKEFVQHTIPVQLRHCEQLMRQNDGGQGYMVGSKLTWADLTLVDLIGWCSKLNIPVNLTPVPLLVDLQERVVNHDGLCDWLRRRPSVRF